MRRIAPRVLLSLSIVGVVAVCGAGVASAAPTFTVWGPLTGTYVAGAVQPIYVYGHVDQATAGYTARAFMDNVQLRSVSCMCTTLGQLSSKDPESSPPQPFTTFDTRVPPDGSRHTLRVEFFDVASGTTQTQSYTFAIDRTPPTVPGGYGATIAGDGVATVSWAPSFDPSLPDGSQGAGTAGYNVRSRVNAGPWSALAQTPFPTVRIPGASVSGTISVEVSAYDAVGNTSASVVATLTPIPDAGDPCDPAITSPPPECQEPPAGTPIDAEPDPDIDLDPSNGMSGAVRPLNAPATIFHLRSQDGGCRTSRCWATIRNRPMSWAVGNVRLEYPSADADVRVTSTIARTFTVNHWHLGSLSTYSNRCAWISGTTLGSPGSQTTSVCADPNYQPSFRQWQAPPFGGRLGGKLVRGNNCYNESGTWRTPGAGTCDRGTAIFLTGPTVECANVFVIPDGNTQPSCRSEDVIRTLNTQAEWSGYCVNWRYVTRDRQWVMVRDPRTLNRGGWVFIRLSALNPDRGTWMAYDKRGTCTAN
jgi:hypothetical protein